MQAPFFQASTNANPRFNFDTVAGRCVVLMFYGSLELQKNRQALQSVCQQMRSLFDDLNAVFFGVCIDPNDPQRGVTDALPGIRFFWDYDLKVSRLYGATSADQAAIGQGPLAFHSFSLVLDPRLRVYDCIPIQSPEQHTSQLRASLEQLLAAERQQRQWVNAPVLIVPNVFPQAFCQRLIDRYLADGGVESGTMFIKDGRTVGKLDRSFKRRCDCYIDDSETIREYRGYLQRNLFPQITRAFHFQPSRIERYLVACYDGEDHGFFRPHRDNTTPGTAHRRFACTINLNAEEYQGGDLRFPEYGLATYRAPTGGAVVFSGSILHEALPVTSGKRFATLPFIHDEAAERIRQQNAANLSEEIVRVDPQPAPPGG